MLFYVESREDERARKNAANFEQWKFECEWHPWFAWYPVHITPSSKVWLSWVERRLDDRERDEQRQWYNWHLREFVYRSRSHQ